MASASNQVRVATGHAASRHRSQARRTRRGRGPASVTIARPTISPGAYSATRLKTRNPASILARSALGGVGTSYYMNYATMGRTTPGRLAAYGAVASVGVLAYNARRNKGIRKMANAHAAGGGKTRVTASGAYVIASTGGQKKPLSAKQRQQRRAAARAPRRKR